MVVERVSIAKPPHPNLLPEGEEAGAETIGARVVVDPRPEVAMFMNRRAAERGYCTRLLSLKIGRMIDIAMKPTSAPMITIMSGSIIEVTPLMTVRSSDA